MANKKNSNYENVVKPIVVLVVICLITSALLAVTNYFTAPIIAAQEQQAAYAAYFEVLPDADNFTSVEGFATSGVEEAVKADNGSGYAFRAIGKGFGGDVPVIVGVNMDGVITGVSFLQNSETSGFGARLWDGSADGPAYAAELTGKSGSVALGQDGVNGLSGATVTSTAVVNAVNSALSCFAEVALGQAAVVEQAAPTTLEEAVAILVGDGATYTPVEFATAGVQEAGALDDGSGYVFLAVGTGFGGDVPVAVVTDASGVITGVSFLQNSETSGFGARLYDGSEDGPAFAAQLVGKSGSVSLGSDGVDGLSGATISSTAVVDAVNSALSCYNEVAQGGAPVEAPAAAPASLDEAVTAFLGEGAVAGEAEGATAVYTSADGALTLIAVESEGYSDETAPLTVATCFDADGVVTNLWVDVSGQTQGLGSRTGEADFTDLFVGLSDAAGVDGVDAIASVTESSDGVKAGVAACMEIFQTMKGGN